MTVRLNTAVAFAVILISLMTSTSCSGQSFTVADEIGLAQFGNPYTQDAEAIQLSPDGNYVAIKVERGRLDQNCVEDSLRIYRIKDITDTLRGMKGASQPTPIWQVNRTAPEGPVIRDWRWLSDSSGIAYLEYGDGEGNRLVLADVKRKNLQFLTEAGQAVTGFDIRDHRHYVYSVSDARISEERLPESESAEVVGTGRSLQSLLLPSSDQYVGTFDRSLLWAVVNGQRRQVKDGTTRRPVVLFSEGTGKLTLSPDGRWLVTAIPVPDVQSSWESLYPPPFTASPRRVQAGVRDLKEISSGGFLTTEFSRIDLQTGVIEAMTDAPTASNSGWFSNATPSWSSDGQAVLLPGTFVRSEANTPSKPCVAVWYLHHGAATCVEALKGLTEAGAGPDYYMITNAQFIGGDQRRIKIQSYSPHGNSNVSTEYQQLPDGSWIKAKQNASDATTYAQDAPVLDLIHNLKISVMQGLNDPQVLVTTDMKTEITKTIWDPNPQLKRLQLGQATVLKWKDKTGRDWSGGLYTPPNYVVGKRYPLVIQTHGFISTEYRPSGLYPTAFAARALAAAGMVVIQVDTDCHDKSSTIVEASCNVAGFEAVVSLLTKDGVIDPDRVGIIGFSRTCYYVMQTLVASSLRLKAASITDGVMYDYWQHLLYVDHDGNDVSDTAREKQANIMNGAPAFGAGLQQWLLHSPLFNTDKVTAPVMVVAEGPGSLLFMWGPYAALRYLHKPVDLIVLRTKEHVLTNPAERMASQGGTVDWFRFWLQGYEDPDPNKASQYRRWEHLRELQTAENNAAGAPNQ